MRTGLGSKGNTGGVSWVRVEGPEHHGESEPDIIKRLMSDCTVLEK